MKVEKRRTAVALTVAMTLAASVGTMTLWSAAVPVLAEEENVVRMSVSAEPDNLNPWLSAATDTEAIFMNVFDGLTAFDTEGNVIPDLASSWEISEDGLTYTFTLEEGVTFHNGKAFSAEDVVYTFESLAGLNGEEALSSRFSILESVEALDEYTVQMTLSEANAAFLQALRVAVLPVGYEAQETAPVGTGPYRFVEYTPGQRVVLEKYDDYYNEEKAGQIDRAEIYIMSDESASVTALQSGQLDLVTMVSAENAAVLASDYTILDSPQNMVCLWAWNLEEEPFDDVRVRQALSYAVDKEQLIEGAFGGYGTELDSAFSPVMGAYYNEELGEVYDYNPEKALELLAEAGYEDGFSITITVPSNYQRHIDTAVILAEQLKQVNITAELELVEWGTWLEDVYTNAHYQTTIVGLSGKLDPSEILIRYTTGYSKNFFHYSNTEYDTLIAEAALETDEEVRAGLYRDCQAILTEEAASLWTCDPSLIIACRTDLKGYTFYPVGYYDLTSLYYESSEQQQ